LKLRIRADITLDDQRQAARIFNFLKGFIHLYETINPRKPDEKRSQLIFEKCYHDEEPEKPCELIEEWMSE